MNIKRQLDFFSASLLLLITLPIFLFISLLIKVRSDGPILYVSDRIGVQNKIFKMYKFRTMKVGTPPLATHLLTNPEKYLTPVGRFLRKTSLDELPQLFNIIRGEMSVVGPRPALFNQYDLIELRTEKGVHILVPGFTGLAQINGRDELSIPMKVGFDEFYLKHQNILLDFKIIGLTIYKVLIADGVKF